MKNALNKKEGIYLQSESFQSSRELCEFVNSRDINVVSITESYSSKEFGRPLYHYTLFYTSNI